ncbi:MAG: hypothetical protein IV107_24225 [Paucibacter sp.]|nr:hypothetical protein [Roseateles sp.]
MPTPTNPIKNLGPAGSSASSAADQARQRREQLHAQECARRGLRFLPVQVMRPIFEREGLM